MDIINNILQNDTYKDIMTRLKQLEQEREFCRHDWSHVMDVARIAYIISLERHLDYSKEIIYAAAILHDIGRVLQYESGIPHEESGAKLAKEILSESGFEQDSIPFITKAIAGHERADGSETDSLTQILYEADKKSRMCFQCNAYKKCDWDEFKKNRIVIY